MILSMFSDSGSMTHSITIILPVYQGSATLWSLLEAIVPLTETTTTAQGNTLCVAEVLLVDDNGPDDSAKTIRQLAERHSFVRPVWLSRNFGQHAATLAGMASSTAEWIVTLDEDGQHDPASIADMLDVAIDQGSAVVYAAPTNAPPSHNWFRNSTSKMAKIIFAQVLCSGPAIPYHSYRLMLGDVGRSVAAYAGSGIYLDVALSWVNNSVATCPVTLSSEGDRPSGYSVRNLASHFWRLVLSSGTRPLRIMSVIGATFAAIGFVAAGTIFIGRVTGEIQVGGWASLSIMMLVGVGLVLFSLGLVAEYVGMAATMAMGKPPFLIVTDRQHGPLAKRPTRP